MKRIIILLVLVWMFLCVCGYYYGRYAQDRYLRGKLILVRGIYTNVDANPERAAESLARLLAIHVEEYREARRSRLRNFALCWDAYGQRYLDNRWDRITEVAIPNKDDETGLKWKRPEHRNYED